MRFIKKFSNIRSRFSPLFLFAMGTAGIVFLLLLYCFLIWDRFIAHFDWCPQPFCDFVEYYYPMGETIFRTGIPVQGFLYSPFIAILLAVFPLLGPSASLVLWGILQFLFAVLYIFLFRRLVPAGLPIQLLFVALMLSSFPFLLNQLGGQVSVFMMVSILGLLVLYEGGRRAPAAGLLTLAVSFKFYPVILLAPFAARRDTRFILISAAACGTILLMIPGLLLGFGDTFRFYGSLLESFRDSRWVTDNPHSQFFPHLIRRLADGTGYNMQPHMPLLFGITYGVAAANMWLIFLVQRARLKYANLWSFQMVFLTVPFVLKTSWPHDFIFLAFTQAFLVWWLMEGGHSVQGRDQAVKRMSIRTVMSFSLILLSIVFSSIVFFNFFDHFIHYGFLGFLFWANLFLLIVLYVQLLPPVLRRLKKEDVHPGHGTSMRRPNT